MVHAGVKLCVPLAVGTICMCLGVALVFVLDNIVHSMVNTKMTLTNTSAMYNSWKNPQAPVYMQFYVYDIINSYEVQHGKELPYVIQKGPYTYKGYRPKIDVHFNNNGTVSYTQNVTYFFDRSMSSGWDNETLTTINIPLISVASMARYMPDLLQTLIEALEKVSGAELFMKKTVAELLWGYDDDMLKFIMNLTKKRFIKSDKFGIFIGMNNSDNGMHTVYTSADKLNIIDKWQGLSSLPWWNDQYANMINGTDGSQTPPFSDRSKPTYLFSADICRSVYGVFEKEVEVRGITANRFVLDSYILGNVTDNPDNAAYCTPKNNCLPSGLLNTSVCHEGAPIVYSFPHFLYADKDVILPCMNPNKEEHQTLVEYDYVTGISMSVYKRMQVNVHLTRQKDISDLSEINDVYYPVLWLNESFTIDEASATKYKHMVLVPLYLAKITPWVVFGIGCLIVIIALILLARKQRRRYQTPLHGNSIQENHDKEPILDGATAEKA
ncbi:lysosome membrane protein 2-like [Saccoglossus kowalevskii]|uniref:Lysosome membrane protein 2-like n=1 Tax=Saccoglossus kowalevskii TaxID=10224 RepID=A0ABM0MIB2_SACKO|nr:PREDICTED: lysosome membrane protein 2-like [Saccoglossus kowalevskii]